MTTDPTTANPGAKMPRVLLVEDVDLVRQVFKHAIEFLGCDIVGEAVTERDALRLFDEHKPDLILLDIRLDMGDGISVLAEIIKRDLDAYVVMLTSVHDDDTKAKCLELGAKGFIAKGRKTNELVDDVQCHLVAQGLPFEE